MSRRTTELLASLTLDEKVDLVTGLDMWHTRPVPRLGFGGLKVTDGPNGARGDGLMGTGTPTACVPSGSALGATWDPELLERIGTLLGEEARAKGAGVLLAPTINLHRSPRGGRNFECYSEDPLLSGRLAAAFVRGVQSCGVATTPKHFAANDSEFERHTIDSRVDERTLREVTLLPFEMAVVDGGAWGIMSAYNRLNGVFCSEHEWLLHTVLREQWGFDGFVVSDWFAARSTAASARAGLSLEMPGPGSWFGPKLGAAVKAGEVPEPTLDRVAADVLRAAERVGALEAEADFRERPLDREEDRALIREAAAAGTVLLRNDGALPLDPAGLSSLAVVGPNAYRARIMGGGSARVRSYRAVSPLEALQRRLAPSVDVRYAQGCDIDRSTPPLAAPLLRGEARVEYFGGWELGGEPLATSSAGELSFTSFGAPASGVPAEAYSFRARATLVPEVDGAHEVRLIQCGRARVRIDGRTVLDATEGEYERGDAFFGFGSVEIAARVELDAGAPVEVELEYANREAPLLGGAVLGVVALAPRDLLGEAEALAAGCDAAVVVVGTNDDWETEGRDRDQFELPGDQPELIRRIAAVNPRTVVVINAGAPHAVDWLELPAAALQLGFAGQELGDALADVLLGDAEPGGRMPFTVPARPEQFAASLNYPGENGVVRYGEGVFAGHRWHDALGIEAGVPFGHGLSYTTFELSGPRVPAEARAGEAVRVELDLVNAGDRPGSEVVQVYVEPLAPRLQRPLRELKGFAKARLDPGASTTVCVELGPRAFAYYDVGDATAERLASSSPVPAGAGHERREAGWWVDPGEYRIVVGRSSADLVGSASLSLTGPPVRLGYR